MDTVNKKIQRCVVVASDGRCPGPVFSREMCSRHYQKARKYGDPLHVSRPVKGTPCPEPEGVGVCGLPIHAKKMCAKHYVRTTRQKTLLNYKPQLPVAARAEIQRRYVRSDRVNGRAALAREFNVDVATITRIVNGPAVSVEESEPLDPFGP